MLKSMDMVNRDPNDINSHVKVSQNLHFVTSLHYLRMIQFWNAQEETNI